MTCGDSLRKGVFALDMAKVIGQLQTKLSGDECDKLPAIPAGPSGSD